MIGLLALFSIINGFISTRKFVESTYEAEDVKL